MTIARRAGVRRSSARERLVRSMLHLVARRRAREEKQVRRAALRHDLGMRLAGDVRFWRTTTLPERAELLRQLNEDRAHLGQAPLEALPDPRVEELTRLFHQHCVAVQQGAPAEADGSPCLEPFLEEVAARFGEDWLAEQNVNLHQHLALAQVAKPPVPKGKQPREATPTAPEQEEAGPLAAPGPARPVGSWRENYRGMLVPYAVKLVSQEERRARFTEQLQAWRALHQDPEARPELGKRFLAALLHESDALGLGWTPEALLAYAAPVAAEPPAPDMLTSLEQLHAHLAAAQRPQTAEQREAAGMMVLRGLFALDEGTAAGVAGLPPVLQLVVLRNQGVLAAGDLRSKSAWERMVFQRLRPGAASAPPEVRRACQEATRILARETWRYFHPA